MIESDKRGRLDGRPEGWQQGQVPRGFRGSAEDLRAKLAELSAASNLDLVSLNSLLYERNADFLLEGLSKHARRKFRRDLDASAPILERVKEIVAQHKHFLQNPDDQYHVYIARSLTPQQNEKYQLGKWDHEILQVVCRAQKAFMIPHRPPSPSEVAPKARFAPIGNYKRDLNR